MAESFGESLAEATAEASATTASSDRVDALGSDSVEERIWQIREGEQPTRLSRLKYFESVGFVSGYDHDDIEASVWIGPTIGQASEGRTAEIVITVWEYNHVRTRGLTKRVLVYDGETYEHLATFHRDGFKDTGDLIMHTQ
jgi:hypothetical protein